MATGLVLHLSRILLVLNNRMTQIGWRDCRETIAQSVLGLRLVVGPLDHGLHRRCDRRVIDVVLRQRLVGLAEMLL